MDKDNEWVEDVKRWCRAGGAAASRKVSAASATEDDGASFGYEAANPAVQARHWPDASTAFSTVPMSR